MTYWNVRLRHKPPGLRNNSENVNHPEMTSVLHSALMIRHEAECDSGTFLMTCVITCMDVKHRLAEWWGYEEVPLCLQDRLKPANLYLIPVCKSYSDFGCYSNSSFVLGGAEEQCLHVSLSLKGTWAKTICSPMPERNIQYELSRWKTAGSSSRSACDLEDRKIKSRTMITRQRVGPEGSVLWVLVMFELWAQWWNNIRSVVRSSS